jgi:hypothetical protein
MVFPTMAEENEFRGDESAGNDITASADRIVRFATKSPSPKVVVEMDDSI